MPLLFNSVVGDLNDRNQYPALLSKITTQLLQGNYQHWLTWITIVKTHGALKTETAEPDIIIQEIMPRIIIECEQGIEQGNSNAMFLRARIYQHGQGSNIDYSRAILLYEEAIILENSYAMNNRAVMHQNGQGGVVDYPAAITLYEQAIALNNSYAMNNRAIMHQNGQGGTVDYPAAIALYEQAVAHGDTYAMNNRASMHRCGQGGDVDYPAAIALYEQAIAHGDTYAMNNRASMHRYGQGGDVDYPAAIALYNQAIAFNHASAMNNRASMHRYGQGGDVNYSAAIALYEQAIAHDNAYAMNNRASMHRYGQGGNIDYPAAIALYEQAIALKNTEAMNNRADMHQYGQGGDIDYSAAIALYEQAIALKNTEAMNNRANMHWNGQGGNVNNSAAIALYEQAIALGNVFAMHNRAVLHAYSFNSMQATRLYRQAAELGYRQAKINLQDKRKHDIYYTYHNAMLEKNYATALKLIVQDNRIFDEFLEYDWPRFVKNLKQHEEAAIQVISIFTREKTNNQEENTKRLRLLIILMQASSEQTFVSQSLNSILFSSISVWMLSVAQIEALANAFIDACHKLKSEYFASIVTLLSTLIQGISLNDLTSLFAQASFIKETIKLMLKLMYGEKVTLLESAEPSIKQLILLMTNHHFNKSSIADLDVVLPGLFQQTTPICSSSQYPGIFTQFPRNDSIHLVQTESNSSVEDVKILVKG